MPGTYASIDEGEFSLCGIRRDGTAHCTGALDETTPEGMFSAVAAGSYHACALRLDHHVTCWGENFHRQATPP
jgi:hypothetical protein